MPYDLPEPSSLVSSTAPGIGTWGVEIVYMQAQLAALSDSQISAVDTALKALVNALGAQIIPNGHSTLEAEWLNIFTNYPTKILIIHRIYQRALTARYGGGGGAAGITEAVTVPATGADISLEGLEENAQLLLDPIADADVTGIAEPADPSQPFDLWMTNVSAFDVTIPDYVDSGNVMTGTGLNYVLGPEQSAHARWSPSLSLWIIL